MTRGTLPRDWKGELADLLASGDARALRLFAIDAAHAAAHAEDRLAADRSRKRRSRGGGPRSPEPAKRPVTSRDIRGSLGTRRDIADPDPSPSPSPFSPAPHKTPSFPPPRPNTPAHGVGDGEEAQADRGEASLRAELGQHWSAARAFLAQRPSASRTQWIAAMTAMIGPSSGCASADLGAALRDAMLADPPLKTPAQLRAFVTHARDERVTSDRRSRGISSSRHANPDTAKNADRDRFEAQRFAEYQAERDRVCQGWVSTNPEEYAALRRRIDAQPGSSMLSSMIKQEMIAEEVRQAAGFPSQASWLASRGSLSSAAGSA